MEKDSNRTNLIIVVILTLTLLTVGIIVLINNILTKSSVEKNNQELIDNSEEITNTDVNTNIYYNSYNIGDEITLIDSSNWNVIKESAKEENTITILKNVEISTYVKKEEVDTYLKEKYRKILKDNLGTSDNNIIEIRLLSLDDLKNVLNDNNIDINYSINSSYSWLYQNKTLLNNDKTITINNNGTIIEEISNDIFPIRPVVTISKDLIKK